MTPGPADTWSDQSVAEFWRRDLLPRWIPVVVGGAAILTLALIVTMYDLALSHAGDDSTVTAVTGGTLGMIIAAAAISAWWTSSYDDISGWARAAVVLVATQLAVAISAWCLWQAVPVLTWNARDRFPLVSQFPAPTVVLVAVAALWLAAVVDGRGPRRCGGVPYWLSAIVIFALTDLLYLGIWMPLAAPEEPGWLDERAVSALVPRLLGPPALLAWVTASVAILRPTWLRRLVPPGAVILALLLVGALVRRHDATPAAWWVYGNYVSVLASTAVFALGSIVVLAWSSASALRRDLARAEGDAPGVQRGTVAASAGPVAHVTVHGALGGIRASTAGFTLVTARGVDLHVPGGAPVVAPLPAWTVSARAGASRPLLEGGTPVRVSGYVMAPGDGPFRTGGAPVAGPRGLVITVERRAHETIGRDIVLAVFRPCLLFLLLAAAAALPGLVGSRAPADLAYVRHLR